MTGTSSVVQLRGRVLLLARFAWIVMAGLTLIYLVAAVPAEYARLRTVCLDAGCRPLGLSAANVRELEALGLSASFFAAYATALELLFVAISFAVGTALFWRKPDDAMVLFTALVLVTLGCIGLRVPPAEVAGASRFWSVVFSIVEVFGQIAFFIPFLFLFPDGRFVPRWTRGFVAISLVPAVYTFFVPGYPGFRWLGWVIGAIFLTTIPIALCAQIYRYRRVSGPVQRQQTKWAIFGIFGAIVGTQVAQVGYGLFEHPHVLLTFGAYTILNLSLLLIPLSIGVAVLRYRLWEIDRLINRTLVYGALTTCIVVLYVGVLVSLGAIFQAHGSMLVALAATGVAAVLFQPLRAYLQRSVIRVFYGERDEPYVVLSRLGERLETTLAPDAVLPTIVEMVKEALKSPYVAVALKEHTGFVVAAASGVDPGHETLLRLPLVAHMEVVGELRLAPRAPGEQWSSGDQRLLQDLAHQAGVAVQAVRLTTDLQRLTVDLQRSREQLVLAREEERRRLRRDLHDGLGPTLAALALTANHVVDLIPTKPSAATMLADELQQHIRSTVADIRRLVYDLRPPALDELGLVGAVRERALQISRRYPGSGEPGEQMGLRVVVEAPDELPPLPAAVEVAAYRIAQEALTNVVRHAQARTCVVRLAAVVLGDRTTLHVEIADDGVGLPAELHAGVGLRSMRERAEELGGTCIVKSDEGGGTRVSAWLSLV